MESRNSYLKRNYGITEAEYWAQSEFQGHRCAICGGENKARVDGTRERLSVDHSHRSGNTRALLCQRCNRVLGMINDAQWLAVRILEYLREHDGPEALPAEQSEATEK